jgi:hypothetical protein
LNLSSVMATPEWPIEVSREVEQLRADLSVIHSRWRWFDRLFYKQPEEARLEASFAPEFFAGVLRSLADNLITDLARFTDVDKGGRQQNVNLSRVIQTILGRDRTVRAQETIAPVWSKIKAYRDKVHHHRDREVFVGGKSVAGILVGELRQMINAVTTLMCEVDAVFDGQVVRYDDPIELGNVALIYRALKAYETCAQLNDRRLCGLSIDFEFLNEIFPDHERRTDGIDE